MKHFGLKIQCLFILASLMWATVPGTAWAGGCDPSATQLCLLSNQFGVTVEWDSPSAMGSGTVVGPGSLDTGFFYYDDPNAADLLVRVLDGCAVNGQYWVFLAGVSDHGQTVQVTDFNSGSVTQYVNSQGVLFMPVTDTSAFGCAERDAAPAPSVHLGGTDLFLDSNRFQVSLTWEGGSGDTGSGSGVAVTDRSGAFRLFNSSDLEVLVKLAPDADTGFYGFTYSAVASLGLEIVVRDLCEGQTRTYTKPAGSVATAADAMAFSLTCTAGIFSDGFESGDLTGWDLTVP